MTDPSSKSGLYGRTRPIPDSRYRPPYSATLCARVLLGAAGAVGCYYVLFTCFAALFCGSFLYSAHLLCSTDLLLCSAAHPMFCLFSLLLHLAFRSSVLLTSCAALFCLAARDPSRRCSSLCRSPVKAAGAEGEAAAAADGAVSTAHPELERGSSWRSLSTGNHIIMILDRGWRQHSSTSIMISAGLALN